MHPALSQVCFGIPSPEASENHSVNAKFDGGARWVVRVGRCRGRSERGGTKGKSHCLTSPENFVGLRHE